MDRSTLSLSPKPISSFNKVIFNFLFQSEIAKNTLLPSHTWPYDLMKYHPRKEDSVHELLCKIVIHKNVVMTLEDTRRSCKLQVIDL